MRMLSADAIAYLSASSGDDWASCQIQTWQINWRDSGTT